MHNVNYLLFFAKCAFVYLLFYYFKNNNFNTNKLHKLIKSMETFYIFFLTLINTKRLDKFRIEATFIVFQDSKDVYCMIA